MHYKPKVFQEEMTLDNFDLRAGTAEILTGATTYHKKCVYFRNGQFGVKGNILVQYIPVCHCLVEL